MAGNSNHHRKARTPPDREFVSVREAARLQSVQAQLVHQWTNLGKIEGFRINGCIFRYVDMYQVQRMAAVRQSLDGNGSADDSERMAPEWRPST